MCVNFVYAAHSPGSGRLRCNKEQLTAFALAYPCRSIAPFYTNTMPPTLLSSPPSTATADTAWRSRNEPLFMPAAYRCFLSAIHPRARPFNPQFSAFMTNTATEMRRKAAMRAAFFPARYNWARQTVPNPHHPGPSSHTMSISFAASAGFVVFPMPTVLCASQHCNTLPE